MAYDKHQATHEFARWSESYDRCILQWLLFGPTHRAIVRRIRAVARERPIRVLDVGCGTGVFAARILAALPCARIWCIDLVADMLAKGAARWQQHGGSIVAIQGDSERLPFAAESFDIVTCANSFHHYPRQDLAIAEMHRVLRPGGRLMVIDGYRDAPWGWLIYDVCVASIEGSVHHASARHFRDLFAQAGLNAITQKVFRGLAPFLLTEAVARKPVSAYPAPRLIDSGARRSHEAIGPSTS